jgi:glutamate racemase
VFDSGVGGLTVLHECLVSLPEEDYVYLGDTAHFPYGDRPPDELRALSLELAGSLVERGAKLLVVACNSATAAALGALRDAFAGRVEVIGVVDPESRVAAAATRSGRVGLLATQATVASGAYERALAAVAPDAQLESVASPRLAPLIQEAGEVDERLAECVDEACEPLERAGVDTVILGCTHYPLVRPLIQRRLGRDVQIVSSGEAIAADVERALAERGLRASSGGRGAYRLMCTGDPEAFRSAGPRFLALPVSEVEKLPVARVGAGA